MEEKTDVGTEITLDAFDGVEDTSKTESSPAKEAPAADKTPEAETKEESPETDKETEAQPSDDAETQKAEEPDKPLAKADERKAQLNTEIRDLVSQRNALRDEVAKANAEVYQPATEDELLGQINPETGEQYTRAEAKVDALDQRLQVRDYNERVAEAQLTIGHESERVLQDFPMFNPDSPEFDKELGQEAATLLEANLIYDQNTGQVIGSNVSPYQLYKTLARASGLSTVKGQLKGQKDTEQMLANADTAGSSAPSAKPKDPTGLDALWAPDAKF